MYSLGVPAVEAKGAAAQPPEQTHRGGPEVEVRAAQALEGGSLALAISHNVALRT